MTLLGSGKVGANCSRSMEATLTASPEKGCSTTLQSVAELSALRRSTARARWLRSKTDISCKSSECSPDGGASSRAAAAREMRRRIFAPGASGLCNHGHEFESLLSADPGGVQVRRLDLCIGGGGSQRVLTSPAKGLLPLWCCHS